jgi:ABC-type multidrug transport system fused ATPase/permease subunit
VGFIMDGLDKEGYDREYGDRVLLARIIRYFRPHARTMAVVGLLVAVTSLLETAIPIVVSRGVDLLTMAPQLPTLLGLAGLVAALGASGWASNYLRQRLSARAVGDVVLALRNDAFAAVVGRDLSFYDEFASGKIVSRVTSDTQDFSTVVTLTMDLLSQMLLVVTVGVVLFVIDPLLATITIAIAPVVVGVALLFRRVARTTTQQSQRVMASVNATIQESISGIAVAKAFRQEAAIYADFTGTNAQAYRTNLRTGYTFSSIFPILNAVAGVATAIIVYVGGLQTLGGQVSPGDWYLFLQSLLIFYFPLTSIASFWSQFQQGLSATERVFALIDAEPKVNQVAAEEPGRLAGRIEFRGVRFAYVEPTVVLPDFSLVIPAGERLAIVGHTGAGKSSLARLIARFYEFQRGELLIDGRDIRRFDLAAYRRQLGLVPQIPFLFSGAVANNIRYGRPSASDEEVAAAARRIGGGSWVDDLPAGLQTEVGERGASLSLGQRQLVALARVLLHDPAILILDEATASVDPLTEAQIQAGLETVMAGRTSIVIAHRLSTVRAADRIIVLERGRIVEEGTHAALLARGGQYAGIYNAYFRHQSIEYIEAAGRADAADD